MNLRRVCALPTWGYAVPDWGIAPYQEPIHRGRCLRQSQRQQSGEWPQRRRVNPPVDSDDADQSPPYSASQREASSSGLRDYVEERDVTFVSGNRVLMTAPLGGGLGGGAVYCSELQREAPSQVLLVSVGSRTAGERLWRSAGRTVLDAARVGYEIARSRPDVIQLNPSLDLRSAARDGLSLTVARAFGHRPIVFLHGWSASNSCWISRCGGRPARALVNRSAAVVVLADAYRDDLRYWGVTVPIYVESTLVPADTLAALSAVYDQRPEYSGSGLTLLVLGRVTARKGVWTAIAAMRLARETGTDVRVVFAGDGVDLPQLRSQTQGEDWVACLGEVSGEAKFEALRGADALLMPSHTEGMPLSLLEGMAAGLPVVTTRVGGVCDFFVDRQMGYSCPPQNAQMLAAAVLKLAACRHSWTAIGRTNREFALRYFTPVQAWRRLQSIYSAQQPAHGGRSRPSPWYEGVNESAGSASRAS